MSFLGLDVGKKRIGLAIGSMIASEFGTLIIREPAKSFLDGKIGTGQAIDQLKKITIDHRIEKIIIGLPLAEGGTQSVISEQIETFSKQLEESVDIPIELTNESLTSYVAEEMLKEEGLSIAQSKHRVDQLAAKLILQQYIEENE